MHSTLILSTLAKEWLRHGPEATVPEIMLLCQRAQKYGLATNMGEAEENDIGLNEHLNVGGAPLPSSL